MTCVTHEKPARARVYCTVNFSPPTARREKIKVL